MQKPDNNGHSQLGNREEEEEEEEALWSKF